MKKLHCLVIFSLVAAPAFAGAEAFASLLNSLSSRTPATSYKTQSPAGEQVQCFPQKQVDGWKKRKKVKKAVVVPQVVEKVTTKEVIKEVEVIKYSSEEPLKNKAKLFAGFAPGYTGAFRLGNTVTLENKLGPVLGIGYERQLSRRLSVEAVWLFNKSYLLGIGYSF